MDAKTKQVTEQVITTGYSSEDIIPLCVELSRILFHLVALTHTVQTYEREQISSFMTNIKLVAATCRLEVRNTSFDEVSETVGLMLDLRVNPALAREVDLVVREEIPVVHPGASHKGYKLCVHLHNNLQIDYWYFTKDEPMPRRSPKTRVWAYARTLVFGLFQVVS
jgi:hypothetical protein